MSIAFTDLVNYGGPPAGVDILAIVKKSDLTQSPDGSTLGITIANLFTNPTFTTGVTVTGTLGVSGNATIGGTFGVTGLITATAGLTSAAAITAAYASASLIANATTGNPALVFQRAGTTSATIASGSADELVILNHLGATMAEIAGTNVIANTFTGALTGNASTASALNPGRTINGTLFDGSANITIAVAGVKGAVVSANTAFTGHTYVTACTLSALGAGDWIITATIMSKTSAASGSGPQVQLLASTPANVGSSWASYQLLQGSTTAFRSGASSSLVTTQLTTFDTSGTGFGFSNTVVWWVHLTGTTDLALQFQNADGSGDTVQLGAGTSLTAIPTG